MQRRQTSLQGCLPFKGADGRLTLKLPGAMRVAGVQLLSAGPSRANAEHGCERPHRLKLEGMHFCK